MRFDNPRADPVVVSQDLRKMCYKVQDFSVMDPLMAAGTQAETRAYTKDEARGFKELFPDIVRELTYDGPYKDVPTVNAHIAKVKIQ